MNMKLTKQERLQVGGMLHDRSLSFADCMERYGVSRSCCNNWVREYREAKCIPAQAPMGARGGSAEYGSMTKDELIRELMRKDIEAARLKKGYMVRGGGREKEFVSTSALNTK